MLLLEHRRPLKLSVCPRFAQKLRHSIPLTLTLIPSLGIQVPSQKVIGDSLM